MLRTDEIHETNEDLTVMTESERKFSKSDYGLTAAASDRAISGGAASNFKAAKRCLPYVFLTVLTLALLFLPLKSGEFFGSEGDWYSQHVAAAETLRQTMLGQGTIFPQHIGIGGGSNAYDLAYYGLLRPDVLISCLLPGVPMKYIIASYACLLAAAAVNLCFIWLRRKGISFGISLMGALLIASAACFFHSHHQIMFVNYMPFLIAALMGIDIFLEKKKSFLIILSVFMICIHSFFYAPACLAVCLLYYLHRIRSGAARTINGEAKTMNGAARTMTLRALLAVICAVGMAAVLLLPAALDILSTEKDAGSFAEEQISVIDLSLEGLLYSAYGCGLTLLVLYGLLLALWDKKKRCISAAVLICCIIPAVSLALSGFLYARGKMLIPFLPLAVWICVETFESIWRGKQRLNIAAAAMCMIPAFFSQWQNLIIAEGILILIWTVISLLAGRKTEGGLEKIAGGAHSKSRGLLKTLHSRPGKYAKPVNAAALSLLMAVSLCVSYGTNSLAEDYIKTDDKRQSRFELSEIAEIAGDGRYRFDYLSDGYVNSNLLPAGDMNKTAIYSSVSNSRYGSFFYDTMKNPIIAKNRVALVAGENVFFNYFMGIRYLLVKSDDVPFGYTKIAEKDGYAIAENENVLPICYGSYGIITEEEYGSLDFPETITSLAGSEAKEIGAEWTADGIELSEPVDGEAAIISFDIDRRDGKEIIITVEDIKNKLSGKDAAYPNENYTFTYVITSEEPLKKLNVEATAGDYSLKNLKAYRAQFPETEAVMPVFYSELEANQVFSGSVEMERDGWFVTSYPYKDGYHVKVDGKEAETQLVNTAFLGFPLEKGNHDIEITYTAPGFWAGLIISLASFATAAVIIRKERKNKA